MTGDKRRRRWVAVDENVGQMLIDGAVNSTRMEQVKDDDEESGWLADIICFMICFNWLF